VCGVFGIKGWVKVFSSTQTRENILSYSPWILTKEKDRKEYKVIDGARHGKIITAQLEGINNREHAQSLCESVIHIDRQQLPKLPDNEYYWSDLIGLEVFTDEGKTLGRVESMIETGANDVMVCMGDKQRPIPFVQGEYVTDIDLNKGKITVHWDPDF